MSERYVQIHGSQDVREKTVDKTRLIATGEIEGYVLKVQADGSLDFEPVIAYLDDIGDVEITDPSNGDRLFYEESTGKWINKKMTYEPAFRAYLLED